MELPCHVAGGEEQVWLDDDGGKGLLRDIDLPAGRQARDPAIVSGLGDETLLLCSVDLNNDNSCSSSFWQSFERQSSSALLSLSPPHSPRVPPHTSSLLRPETDGQSPAASDTVLSRYVSFAGEFKLPELEPEARASSDIFIDYIPLQKLKDRLISDEDDGLQSMQPSCPLACSTVCFPTLSFLFGGGMYWIPRFLLRKCSPLCI